MDLVLIDGMNLAFAASSVFDQKQSLTTSQGVPTGMIYGFFQKLKELRKRFPSAAFHVAWEGRDGVLRRRQLVAEYKANRAPRGNTRDSALSQLQDLLEATGVHQWHADGYEGDDVLATLVRQHESQRKVIVSTDRDFYQLVEAKTLVFNPQTKKFVGAEEVRAAFGVSPEHMLAFRAFDGDTGDNLPRVPRLRNQTLVRLVEEYGGCLESMLAPSPEFRLTGNEREKIATHAEMVRRNASVMLLHEVSMNEMKRREGAFDEDRITEICCMLEFAEKTRGMILGLAPGSGFHSRQGSLYALYQLDRSS